jgi:hydroxymethylpyrimidine pyrophosphatase-like HAD family hydrolase
MRYLALACDYDGTLATDGHLQQETLAALKRFRASGRKLILVTGRELDDLLAIFPQVDLFDQVVAENGALLYQPGSRHEQPLTKPPPSEFVRALQKRGVVPLSVGRVIVATCQPQETTVLQVIREQGLDLEVIFNKGAVMILPSGVNKASGLASALRELAISPQHVVGIGDAENDYDFLHSCGYAMAVANALPSLKERADMITCQENGAGVVELIDMLLQPAGRSD